MAIDGRFQLLLDAKVKLRPAEKIYGPINSRAIRSTRKANEIIGRLIDSSADGYFVADTVRAAAKEAI